jgi:hypothetical protein
MVEFPFVGPAGRKGLRRRQEIYPRYRRLLTLILRHQTGHLTRLVCGKLAHPPQASMRGGMSPCGMLTGDRGRPAGVTKALI